MPQNRKRRGPSPGRSWIAALFHRRPKPVWMVALAHVLALGVALLLYALPHHVIPSRQQDTGIVSSRASIQQTPAPTLPEATAQPESAHREQRFQVTVQGRTLAFTSDSGVFSRGEVDFGTDALLNALPESIQGRVLDLGCGWGAVGVSVGKRYPDCRIVMTDVNARAAVLAAENARANGVKAETVIGDGLENVTGAFDYILTNPPIRAGKQVIYALFAACAKRLTEKGEMYLVIRKQQGAESAVRYLKTLFGAVDTVDRSGGFHVICCREAKENDV